MLTTDQIMRLLGVVADHDCCHGLRWNNRPGGLEFFFICSDTFEYACADGEEIDSGEDITAFDTACADLEAVGRGEAFVYGWMLYAARRRKQKPLQQIVDRMEPEVRRLFEEIEPTA